MKYLTAVILILVIGLNIGHLLTKDKRKYVPGQHKSKIKIVSILTLGGPKRPLYIAKEKSRLKQLGTSVAIFFADNKQMNYLENPNDFGFDLTLFHASHLKGTNLELPKDWILPDSWEAFNNSQSPFVFLPKENTKYTGAAEAPLFITRYGYQAGKDFYQAVYEDGHVALVPYDEAVELWKQAGAWNGEGK